MNKQGAVERILCLRIVTPKHLPYEQKVTMMHFQKPSDKRGRIYTCFDFRLPAHRALAPGKMRGD